jgi:hypothetical protein
MSSNVNSLHAIIYDSSKNNIVATSKYSTHRKGGESPYYNIIEEYNNKGKLIHSIPSKYFPNGAGLKIYDNLSIVFSFNKLFLLDDSHIMVQEFSNDTLFEYKNNSLIPRIVLNNKDFIPRFKVSSSCKRSKDIKFDKNPYWLCIGGNNRFLFIRNIKSNSIYIYNRKDSKLRKCIFNSKYFDCIGSVPIDKVYSNKYFMRLLSADKFLEKTDTTIEVIKKHQGIFFKQIQSIRKNITDESNPVLLIYRLRK